MAAHDYEIGKILEGASVRDQSIAYHLEGELHAEVYPWRRVIDIPGQTWPAARPEECQNNRNIKARWCGRVLLCLGCGLDLT